MLSSHPLRSTVRVCRVASGSLSHSSAAAASVLSAPLSRCLATGATGRPPAAAAASPPPMEMPAFFNKILDKLRRRAFSSPNVQAMQLYQFALRSPLGFPASSSASKALEPVTGEGIGLAALNLPDDELTRYRLVGLHLWMLQKVLLTSLGGAEAQDAFLNFHAPTHALPAPSAGQRKKVEFLFEHFWQDMTPFLTEARGEIRLTKTMKSVQEYFYGAFLSLDMAWMNVDLTRPAAAGDANADGAAPTPLSSSEASRDQLAAALWRNYYMSDTRVSKKDVYRLIYYMQRQMKCAAAMPKDMLWNPESLAALQWVPNATVFHRTSGALNDRVLTEALGITPAAWSETSFDRWQTQILVGQTFDTRLKK